MLKWMHTFIVYNIFIVGCCVCIVTALPFGLDQMPDASSSSITSFNIPWFVCRLGTCKKTLLNLMTQSLYLFALITFNALFKYCP